MAFKVQVGPAQIAIHQGQSVLLTEADGQVNWPSNRGLYFRDTRVISAWAIYANGEPWDLLNGGAIAPHAARIFQTNRAFESEDGPIAARTLGLVIGRHIEGGQHEDFDVTNNRQHPARFNLEIAIRADFADLFEVKSDRIVRRGRIAASWSDKRQVLRITYNNRDFCREVIVRTGEGDGETAVNTNGRLSFDVALKAGQAWDRCLIYDLADGAKRILGPRKCTYFSATSDHAGKINEWQRAVLKIETSNEEFYRCYNQGIQDMAALRLPLKGTDHMVFVPAAGLPWFVALFGRDTLIVSLQTMIVYPEFAAGALEVLAEYQATERDDYRDAEPGKILHELRYGELAHFKLIPHTPYYGTADATPLYLVALHAAWRATGDRSLIERHLPNAEACLTWIDKYGDRDGDGFQEYQTRSTAGYENMAWKDSGDAVMYPDGTLVRGPKALCELQGYVYDAWQRMAEIYDELGNKRRANALRKKAAALFEKFNEDFWDEQSGFYAFALDGEKKKVLSVASNLGQCLWSGIIAPERAGRVVKRLMGKDMWSGWGIRTLSADHPAFNPYNYQTGAVWPHDNSLIALGMRRYGFAAEAAAVAHDISRAASHFRLNQLPELYGGLQRDATSFPVQYLGANVPQAWAAGAPFTLLQAMLGLQQDAPRGKLYVDPALPDWLPDVTLTDLRLGRKRFDIRFWRDGKDTLFKVLAGKRDSVEWKSVALSASAEGTNMTDVISITRRGFMIGGSAVAGAVAATSSAKRVLAQGGPTERLAYVGCYTPPGEGIVLYRVNADTGAMTQVKVFSGISNPSWIALDPLHRVLYAVNEDEPSGGVSAFTVDHASGDLKLINKVDSHGKWPCHLSVHPSGKFVLVANYGTGNVSVFPILANGGLGDPTDMGSDTGPLNPPKAADNPPGNFAPSDHTGPKMHMIQTDPSGQFIIANDAGLDKTLIWTLDLQTGKLTPAATPSVPSTPGSAPRHFAFLPNGRIFYNLHEQDGIVTVADFDPKTGAMKEKQSISVLPKGFGGSNLCSELAVSPDGRFVYAAARGHDAIAGLAVGAGGELTWASEAWSHADYPRSFAIDPAGRFLFACNQKGDAVTSFQIDPHSGGLTFTGQFVPVGAPVTMTFLT